MKRSIYIIILFLFIVNGNIAQKIESIEKEFSLNWVADIGNVTYRTNLIVANNNLLIGSNGNNYRDYAIDKDNGLKVIDAKKGKVKRVILGESYGDVDVNGVKVYDDKIYFGNDNDEFICSDITGNILWRLPISGDVEHEPILIKSNDNNFIVFATEAGELRAVDPKNGNAVWEHFHPNFKGWRQGDNRYVFKIKTHFRSGGIFFSKPALLDLNLDGVVDLIYSCNYDEIRAINGANGKLLWNLKNNDKDIWSLNYSYFLTPIVAGKGSQVKILVPKHKYDNGTWVEKIFIYDRKGKYLKVLDRKSSLGSVGLNTLNISSEKVIIPFTNAIGLYNANQDKLDFIYGTNLKRTYTDWQNNQQEGIRFSYDPLLGNQLIKYKNEECVLLLHQADYAIDDQLGVLSIVGLNSKKIHHRFHLPSGSEFVPHISDVNKDGKLDLLVGCYDGRLYCYNTGISSRDLLTKEKKYSISETDQKIENLNATNNATNKSSIKKNLIEHETQNKSVVDASNSSLPEPIESNDKVNPEKGLSSANLYFLFYASFALLVFVSASVSLFRNKEEGAVVDQA